MVKLFRIVGCLFLLMAGIMAIFPPTTIIADDTPTPTPTPVTEEVQITAKYPKLEVIAGDTASFELTITYVGPGGGQPKVFDLVATAPQDWDVMITPSYPQDKKIASIQLTPGYSVGETIDVQVTPAYWLKPNPGEYPVTLVATSGNLKGSIQLQAVVTAKYSLYLTTPDQRLDTTATAGKDNYFTIDLLNTGTSDVNDLSLTADKPQDWSVTFSPSKIDSLTAGNQQSVDINIKPSSNTIAGDYLITLHATGKQTTAQSMDVRVTVQTPTIWGIVGIIIVAVVIVGLVLTFRQFSRR